MSYACMYDCTNNPSFSVRRGLNPTLRNGGMNNSSSGTYRAGTYCVTNPPNPGTITQLCLRSKHSICFDSSIISAKIRIIGKFSHIPAPRKMGPGACRRCTKRAIGLTSFQLDTVSFFSVKKPFRLRFPASACAFCGGGTAHFPKRTNRAEGAQKMRA